MSPDPDKPFDPEEIPYFFDNWCSLSWSPWVPFNADKHTFKEIPHEPGLYRIRPAGKDFLMYIGETGRPLHQRLSDLRQNLRRADLMPWSDPHPEAPALWTWWSEWLSSQEEEKTQVSSTCARSSDLVDEKIPKDSSTGNRTAAASSAVPPAHSHEGEDQETEDLPENPHQVMLECSAAPLDASAGSRKAMLSYLLYRYRQERGESPLCNFGRFHPRYRKSTSHREGLRGGKLAQDQKDNPAGHAGTGPLVANGRPGDSTWMGLTWTDKKPLAEEYVRIPAGAGVYLLADAGSQEIVYIGQSEDLTQRLLDHCHRPWDSRPLQFSYAVARQTDGPGQTVLPHILRELKNDLIGNFYESGRAGPGEEQVPGEQSGNCRRAPEFQYRQTR